MVRHQQRIRWIPWGLLLWLIAIPAVGQESNPLPVHPVPRSDLPLSVSFSMNGIWFRLPGGRMLYWGTILGGGSATASTTANPLPYTGRTNWVTVSAGNGRGYGILSDQSLVVWGDPDPAVPTAPRSMQPIPFPTPQKWAQVTVGDEVASGIDTQGRLWTWGVNTEFGLGGSRLAPTSTPVEPMTNTTWIRVQCGNYGFIGLRTDGSLWAWGTFPGSNRLILRDPVAVAPNTRWSDLIASAPLHVRNRAGELWKLSLPGSGTESLKPILVATNTVPGRFVLNWGRIWEIRGDGMLWVRPNPSAPAGYGETFAPKPVGTRRDWLQLWGGGGSFAGVTADGVVWVWGTDLPGKPVYSLNTRIRIEINHLQQRLGTAPTAFSYGGTKPVLDEPVPLFQITVADPESVPPRSLLAPP